MRRQLARPALVAAALLLVAAAVHAQSVTTPPSGGNQKSSVSQHIGLVEVTIDYSSPDVTSPSGVDRTGKIWGQLVPYGLTNLGFGSCQECPWRAGSNENTVFTVSHDVEIQGQPLAAGSYGLHMIAGEEEWSVIFSENSTSWGSFFYDASEDALRVTTKAEENDYTHWLTYDFTDRQGDQATVALKWEHLKVPFTISVPDPVGLYVANMRQELRSSPGFSWQSWNAAAQYCLGNNTNLEEALTWAQSAVGTPFVGQENFTTLSTLSQLQAANDQDAEAEATMAKAINHATAGPIALHQYGRSLIAQGQAEKALEVFELNARRHPDTWPVNVGLARGHSALGHYKDAIKHAKLALENAPDDLNRNNLKSMIVTLGEGKDVN